jgi:UDP-glucuronate 4-epimerase
LTRVLVTGGAGFIGSHVCQRLLAAGQEVHVLDNLDPFYEPTRKQRNLQELSTLGGSRFRYFQGDIRDGAMCKQALAGCDAVVHLAALAGVRPSIQDPVRYMDVNVTGTQMLLNQIDSSAVRFVFGGSSSVYGGNTKVPFAEEDPVEHPVSPYAASKRAGELLCSTFHHLRGNPVACLRFFTVYGPRQRPEMAIHQFARCILGGQPLPFFGNGESRRDYTYVEDIVTGVVAATGYPKGFGIYNLGGSATTSLRELVEGLEAELGRKAILRQLPEQPGDVPITYADIRRAERDLGYRCTTPVREGLRRFCEWYRIERDAGRLP